MDDLTDLLRARSDSQFHRYVLGGVNTQTEPDHNLAVHRDFTNGAKSELMQIKSFQRL